MAKTTSVRTTLGKNSVEVPDFLMEGYNERLRSSMKENRELRINAAIFDQLKGRNWEERFLKILSARELFFSSSIAHWRHQIEQNYLHFEDPIDSNTGCTEDTQAHAYYLRFAMLSLLNLVDAPEQLKAEAEKLLNRNQPAVATKRGNVKAALIVHPELANRPNPLAKAADCDRRLVDRYLDEGSVQKML